MSRPARRVLRCEQVLAPEPLGPKDVVIDGKPARRMFDDVLRDQLA